MKTKLLRSYAAIIVTGFAASFFAGSSMAESVAPEDVVFNMDDYTIEASLTGVAGDAENGRKLAFSRKKGNCLACHVMPIPEQSFHGEVGPSLWGIGETYNVEELRFRVVNYKLLNEEVIMPGFYRDPGELKRPLKKFVGKTVLQAQEVEDILAYLMTLTEEQPE
ncbi:MAG: sulfur oxidation c-type cytochrome SoxX [Alphaproteobacteria bacterium]